MTNRKISTLGKTNKSKLLKELGFRNINEAIMFYGDGQISKRRKFADNVKNIAYTMMMNEYNKIVEQLQTQNNNIKKAAAKEKREQKKIKTFLINLNLMIVYRKKNSLTGETYLSKPYFVTKTEGTYRQKINTIPSIVEKFNEDDGYKIVSVQDYNVEFMKLNIKNTSKLTHLMKRGFILKNDWLPYAKSISENAFHQTDDKCVYYQLEKFLLDPPTGRPTKFIDSMRMGENTLFEYFNHLVNHEFQSDKYPEFDIQSGVSTEMIARLCVATKRNMYAYDEDSKCFYSVTSNSSKHYCPIVFYKIHGHFYIIDDPTAIRSVAESNKQTAKKIITSSIEENKKEGVTLDVYHIENFPLDNIHSLQNGVYILQQSNLNDDILKYINAYSKVPKTKNNENVIVQIKVKNFEDQDVYIACDTNYGKNIDYDKLQNVATQNSIKYVNEGIGSVLQTVLDNKTKDKRKHLSAEEKQILLDKYNSKCACCELYCETCDFDHIIPLACGGSNELSNIQPLCKDCHKKKTIEENEQGIYHVKDEAASFFNDIVHDNIFNNVQFKSYQFVEKVNNINAVNGVFKIDMRKCRRNILLSCQFEFPVYSVMDIPKTFQGEIKCGMYYVVSTNTFPFRGSGWYHQPLVEYGLDKNIIEMNNIILEFLPSKVLPASHFQKPINELLDAFKCEPDLQKLCINAYIGLMGRTKQVSSYSKFNLSADEAGNWFAEQNSDSDVFIKNHELANGLTLYEGIFSKEILSESSKYPIYSMILQMEALELHKLETIIIDEGGIILDRNTDAIRYCSRIECNISNYFWDNENTIEKYQKEEANELSVERLPNMLRSNNLDITKFELCWKIGYDYECLAEEMAKTIIDNNSSLHIDGRAGTGKTFLANKVIDEIKIRNKKYLAFSPTNKGARLIGGNTIHSMYYKYQHNKKRLFEMMKNTEYIFIDEVSMMIEKFYQLFMMIKRTFSNIKFIIVGDFDQLPPVKDNWEGDYKNSSALWSLCDGNRIQLLECRRADKMLFNACKSVETIDLNEFPVTEKTFLNLAYTHRTRIQVNNECMERYLKNGLKYLFLEKDKTNPKTQNVKLAKGMPIIAHTTNKKMNILNSEKFVIKSITNEIIIISDGERNIEIKSKDFHLFFYLGFCITIHASQGETFTEKYTIYDWKFKRFCNRAKYVALSRGTDIKNIQISL